MQAIARTGARIIAPNVGARSTTREADYDTVGEDIDFLLDAVAHEPETTFLIGMSRGGGGVMRAVEARGRRGVDDIAGAICFGPRGSTVGFLIDWEAVLAPTVLVLGSSDSVTTYAEIQPFVEERFYADGFKLFNATNPSFYLHAGATHLGYTDRLYPERPVRIIDRLFWPMPTLETRDQRTDQINMVMRFFETRSLENCGAAHVGAGAVRSARSKMKSFARHFGVDAGSVGYNACGGVCFPSQLKVWDSGAQCMAVCCQPFLLHN